MTGGCILSIDQGTSSTKAVVVDENMCVVASASASVNPTYGEGGAVELDPAELWRSVLDAGQAAVAQSGRALAGVALANQGETVLCWDEKTGEPSSPAIVWQDRRAQPVCDRLQDHADEVTQISGLTLDPYFSAPKMAWLRETGHTGGVVTTTDTWLLHKLTGQFVTDVATAGRAALLDLKTLDWSDTLLDLFGLDPGKLPEVVPCDHIIGDTTAFGASLPVAGVVVDQQAALFAEGCHERGEAKCTYGTGAFLLANTGHTPAWSSTGLVACPAWRTSHGSSYCFDGQVYTVGSVIDWLIGVGVVGAASELDDACAGYRPGTETFVPGLAGLAAPYWRPQAHGSLTGVTLASSRTQVVGAVLEGLAAAVAGLCQAVDQGLPSPVAALRVDGGLTRSRALMQMQADLLQRPVEVYAIPDATALGAAAFARLGLGHVRTLAEAIAGAGDNKTVYEPAADPAFAAERIAQWQAAVERTTGEQQA